MPPNSTKAYRVAARQRGGAEKRAEKHVVSSETDLKQERHVFLAQRARELLGRGETVWNQPHLQ